MTPIFAVERTENRKALLEAVVGVKDTLESHSEESESQGPLARELVDALYHSGLLRLKLPLFGSDVGLMPNARIDWGVDPGIPHHHRSPRRPPPIDDRLAASHDR